MALASKGSHGVVRVVLAANAHYGKVVVALETEDPHDGVDTAIVAEYPPRQGRDSPAGKPSSVGKAHSGEADITLAAKAPHIGLNTPRVSKAPCIAIDPGSDRKNTSWGTPVRQGIPCLRTTNPGTRRITRAGTIPQGGAISALTDETPHGGVSTTLMGKVLGC